jgi:cytochrome c peroxidase
MRSILFLAAFTALFGGGALVAASPLGESRWSDDEKRALLDLRLETTAAPPDPSNRYADDGEAARLGRRFFFDPRFSSNGKVSCASCHDPANGFQDGTPLATGVGTTKRRTMPLAGVARSNWFFWDGRKDSLWSQALGPLESAVEHGGDRAQYVRLVASAYAGEYRRVFGPFPDLADLPAHASPNGSPELRAAWHGMTPAQQDAVNRVVANVGKAVAAYERKLEPGVSRFDRYVDAVAAGDPSAARRALGDDEVAGLRLFIGKGSCAQCHNGPQLTNGGFANTGVADAPGRPPDGGRLSGAHEVRSDEFNCVGRYSDAAPGQCTELDALVAAPQMAGQMKVPSLRGVAERPPYMHAGQLATLEQVIDHYDRAPAASVGTSEIKPLRLTPREKSQLVLFLRSLSAPLATEPRWLEAPESGPSDSEQSRFARSSH